MLERHLVSSCSIVRPFVIFLLFHLSLWLHIVRFSFIDKQQNDIFCSHYLFASWSLDHIHFRLRTKVGNKTEPQMEIRSSLFVKLYVLIFRNLRSPIPSQRSSQISAIVITCQSNPFAINGFCCLNISKWFTLPFK